MGVPPLQLAPLLLNSRRCAVMVLTAIILEVAIAVLRRLEHIYFSLMTCFAIVKLIYNFEISASTDADEKDHSAIYLKYFQT